MKLSKVEYTVQYDCEKFNIYVHDQSHQISGHKYKPQYQQTQGVCKMIPSLNFDMASNSPYILNKQNNLEGGSCSLTGVTQTFFSSPFLTTVLKVVFCTNRWPSFRITVHVCLNGIDWVFIAIFVNKKSVLPEATGRQICRELLTFMFKQNHC